MKLPDYFPEVFFWAIPLFSPRQSLKKNNGTGLSTVSFCLFFGRARAPATTLSPQ